MIKPSQMPRIEQYTANHSKSPCMVYELVLHETGFARSGILQELSSVLQDEGEDPP